MDHRAVEDVLRRVADRRAPRPRASAARRSRRRPASCDDRRCPATCSAGPPSRSRRTARPRTARSRSASAVTTIGFLPPSSRHGDCRWRPQSAPISRPTALEPVKPTLSTRPSSSARSRPANVVGPVGLHDAQHAVGQPAGLEQRAERLAQRGRVVGGLPDDRVAAQQRRHEVPGRHRDREVAGGDDRRHADRHAEGEQLLVGHLARRRSGRRAGAPRRGRSRTCRRSPGPRRAPRRTACRSRA